MFERFTPQARRAVVLAQNAAREMGHAQIKPEHLLIGLQQGEGMAANAMSQAGVDPETLRQYVAARYDNKPSAKKINKVPFSAEAKKCLEQSLRAALSLGHSYIGTEHLFFGVERQAEGNTQSLDEPLGVSAAEVHRRLMEMLEGATSGPATRSPALLAALDSGRARARRSAMTTGHVLGGMLADPDSQVAHALTAMGVDLQQVQTALDGVNLAETSDASPAPRSFAVTVGDTTTVIDDPDVAGVLAQLTSDELQTIIKRGIAKEE
jgi:ATP-dependent Clp protease ATP-binding subunit ClpA